MSLWNEVVGWSKTIFSMLRFFAWVAFIGSIFALSLYNVYDTMAPADYRGHFWAGRMTAEDASPEPF